MKRSSNRALRGLAIAAVGLCTAIGPHRPLQPTGTFKLELPAGPFFSQSRIRPRVQGAAGPYSLSIIGSGTIENGVFIAPDVHAPQSATIVAASAGAIATASVRIVPPPPRNRSLIAVASYYDGIVLHDPKTFARLGLAGIGGPPGDVAFLGDGSIAAPDTDGQTLTVISRSPWRFAVLANVPDGNEVAVLGTDIFVTDREMGTNGALTRISAGGNAAHVTTGVTAEGITIDPKRRLVYVGNVNDNSVAEVSADSMQIVRRIRSVERTFGVALDERTRRLFVVSNVSPSMNGRGGFVAAIDLRQTIPRIVARSTYFTFPLGAAFDARYGRLYVTDEARNQIYVLNANTLRAARAPLGTCATPWRPRVVRTRLYVPCARANRVDVFDTSSLRRLTGAPFATGDYPLSVSQWP